MTNKITTNTNNNWYRYQFLFYSNEEIKDKLIRRLIQLESERAKWQHPENYGVSDAFEFAKDAYDKLHRIRDVGKFIINFDSREVIVWIKFSFYYEIDICIPITDALHTGDIIKNFGKINFYKIENGEFRRENKTKTKNKNKIPAEYDLNKNFDFIKTILSGLQDDIISWSVLLNFHKYESMVEVGTLKIEAPVENLLNISLSEITFDYTALSKTANTHFYYAKKHGELSPLIFIQFYDKPGFCIETDGGSDIIHDINSLHLAGKLLKYEKYLLSELGFKIADGKINIYPIIENTISSKQDINELKNEFLKVINLKKDLEKHIDAISGVRRTTYEVTGRISVSDETIINGKGIIKHFYSSLNKKNEEIDNLLKKLYKNSNSLEEIVLKAISTETLSGIHKSVSVQEGMTRVLESTHLMHVGILVLEIVIFAELFMRLIEAYPHISGMTRFYLMLIAILLGVICAVLLTRFIAKNNILDKILR